MGHGLQPPTIGPCVNAAETHDYPMRNAAGSRMMSPMKTQDPSQDLQDGVDLARDLRPEPRRNLAPPHPRLCEAGPCRNYHRLEDQIDDGSTMGTPSFHIRVTHYCYPSPGIEMPLGALPVVRCNRWDPIADDPVVGDDADNGRCKRRRRFEDSYLGKMYAAEVKAWEAGQRETSEENP